MRRVRLDWVTESPRKTVDVSALGVDEVFHYSIPVIEATGDGTTELVSTIDSSKLLLSGDEVLVSKLNPRKSRVVLVTKHDVPTVCSGEFVPLVAGPDIDRRFLLWRLSSADITETLSSQVRSATRSHQRVEPDVIRKLWIDLPDLQAQRRVATYLDEACSRMDALLEEQQRQEDLLLERRVALITHAVTSGLDNEAPVRDSGVDWMGDIPAHWNVVRFKNLGQALIGLTYSPLDVVRDPSAGTLVLRAGNIQADRLDLQDAVYVTTVVPDALRHRTGDLLICSRNGSARLVGKSAVIPEELKGATWGAFMTVFRSSHNKYLAWVLRSSLFAQQLGTFATSTINQLTRGMLLGLQIPMPPALEQDEICQYLDLEVQQLDALVEAVRASSRLIRERRQALITAAVTEQLEVA